jgi:hypothetical protein
MGVALALTAALVACQEYLLARRGFVPTIVDSPSIWAKERARASALGQRAIVLIGASRIQLDVHLDTLRDLTGREPVQLAIDGSSFVPVLADLAADDRVTGTVIVDYQDPVIEDLHPEDATVAYLAAWQRSRARSSMPDFETTESWLGDQLHSRLRGFADGTTPFRSLALRVIDTSATPQYLVTLPSRERRADYSRVTMPQFYYARVMRNAGFTTVPAYASWGELDATVRQHIAAMPTARLPRFAANTEAIAGMVRRIEGRGGHVVFLMLPRSGLVRAADEKLYPRDAYWNPFVRAVGAPALDYRDVPSLAQFTCPDGSHLDARDQVAFTRDLVDILYVRGGKASRGG